MTNRIILFIISTFAAAIWMSSCKHEPFPAPSSNVDSFGNFPPEIGRIFVKKCAEGCHDPANKEVNNNLAMDTWEHLFEGGNNGAVVVPYSPQYSSLMYFINTDSSRGVVVGPTMPYNKNPPYNRPPLSDEEYNTIRDWIAKGAPDKNGNIPFASNAAARQKIYMTMQGCGLVGVIDAKSKLIMRYIKVTGSIDDYSPHTVRFDDAGKYAYVCFSSNGQTLVKIDATTDQVVSRIPLNMGGSNYGYSWNAFHVSGNKIAVTNLSSGSSGKIMIVDSDNPNDTYPFREGMQYPHGITSNASFDTFYVTAQYSNAIYRVWARGYEEISIDGYPVHFNADTTMPSPNPHEIAMSPDGSKLFITCQGTNEVRILDPHTNAILGAIPVGRYPQEMAFSKKLPLLFVTCMEDGSIFGPPSKGSIYIIDYNTNARVGIIEGKFAQPHGIAVDDINGLIFFANRNVDPNGIAPHHTSDCGNGRNGFYQPFDLFTRQSAGVKNEATPDPYGCDVRFK